jgi:hypothetical protein
MCSNLNTPIYSGCGHCLYNFICVLCLVWIKNHHLFFLMSVYTFWFAWGQKKICVFTVTRPTLIFASDPMNFTQNSDNHFCCLISSNVLFIQLLAFCRNWEQRRKKNCIIRHFAGNFENEILDSGNDYFQFCW